jgi:OFA family oxalate/formate antiporter-like MFS transporter
VDCRVPYFFADGLLGSAQACQIESLALFYVFFGVVSGIGLRLRLGLGLGLGLGYISPIATLVKWFLERRERATGRSILKPELCKRTV